MGEAKAEAAGGMRSAASRFSTSFGLADQQRVQHPVDRETGDVPDPDGLLADAGQHSRHLVRDRAPGGEAGITSTSFMRETGEK